MRWHRETEDHNSRHYEGAPRALVVSNARLTVAWLLDIARTQFGKLLKASSKPSLETILLKPGDERGFTVLGLPLHSPQDSATADEFGELRSSSEG